MWFTTAAITRNPAVSCALSGRPGCQEVDQLRYLFRDWATVELVQGAAQAAASWHSAIRLWARTTRLRVAISIDPLPSDVALRLAGLAAMTDGMNVDGAILRILDACRDLLPILGASVTIRQDGHDFTFGASNDLVRDLDERQYDNEGPCTEALHTDQRIVSPDLRSETRWASWTHLAIESGVLSMMSLPLPAAGLPAVLNLYGRFAHGMDDPAVSAVADVTAAHAGALLHNVDAYSDAIIRAGQLSEAMRTRASIEQAKGALMAMLGIDEAAAWAYLVELSQRQNDKLRKVAVTILREAAAGRARPR